jgi:hypothetical protein
MMHSWRPAERLDSILDTCIDRLGSEPPDAILQRYPQSAPALAPLLYLATALHHMGMVQLPPTAKQRGRVRLRQAVLAQQRRRHRSSFGAHVQRAVVWAVLLLVILTTGFGGITVASADALPNDRLYVWKRASEDVWLRVQPSPERKAIVALGMADRRVDEVAALYRTAQPIDAVVVEQIAVAYTQALGAIAAAPPAEQATLIDHVHAEATEHTATLASMAEQASGPSREQLQAAAALGEWARGAQPGDRPGTPGRRSDDEQGVGPPANNNGVPVTTAVPRAQPSTPNVVPSAAPPQHSTGRPEDKGPPPGQDKQPDNPGQSNGHTKQADPSPGLAPTAEMPGIGVDQPPNDNGNNGNNGDNGNPNGNKPDQPPGQEKKEELAPSQPPAPPVPPEQPAPPADNPGNGGNNGGNSGGNNGGGKGNGKP